MKLDQILLLVFVALPATLILGFTVVGAFMMDNALTKKEKKTGGGGWL